MPPADNSPQATILYLSRLLAAVAMRSDNNEIRIDKSTIDEVVGSDGKRALFEDFDEKANQIVLTYRPKPRATYLVEGVAASTMQPITTPLPTSQTHSRMPLTDEQIVNLQRKLAAESQYRTIKREPPQSFNP